MRRLRTPLITLILVYFISVSILVLIPGADAEGNPVNIGYLDAAYFVAILSTTIGLGEVPYAFTGRQRLIVFFLIFPNVVAWLYSIGSILGLFLDEQFKAMLARNRFVRAVRWIGQPRRFVDLLQPLGRRERVGDPFYILCGFGSTGSLLAEGLLDRGLRVVAIDQDAELMHRRRIDARFDGVPMLTGDVTDRESLELAGLDPTFTSCQGVIAVTNGDHVNLTIAITSKLLRPDLPVFARSHRQSVCDNLASFRTDAVVNPYEIFARRLRLAFSSPTKYLVQDWLLSVPGTRLREPLRPPSGHWVVCGAGRFGMKVLQVLEEQGNSVTVVDVDAEQVAAVENGIEGRGTEAHTLQAADIDDAVGIVAGTSDDVDNLSILLTAQDLRDELFCVGRQELPQNDELFDASGADLVARPSVIVARRILALATTPLLKTFLDHLEHSADDAFASRVRRRLERILGGHAPNVWVTAVEGYNAQGLRAAREEGVALRLDHLVHNTRSGDNEDLRCVCLLLDRGNGMRLFLPGEDEEIKEGDRLLFAGRGSARREITRALQDPVLLLDFATPQRIPRTAIGRWLARRGAERASEG